jgi:RIO-like serine/threonine protein kinase
MQREIPKPYLVREKSIFARNPSSSLARVVQADHLCYDNWRVDLTQRIGYGCHAEVYACINTDPDKHCLPKDEQFVAKILYGTTRVSNNRNEIKMQHLAGPQIAPKIYCTWTHSYPYQALFLDSPVECEICIIVMSRVVGRTLVDYISDQWPDTCIPKSVLDWMVIDYARICATLAARGMEYSDLSGENIMVKENHAATNHSSSQRDTLVLIDFGHARKLHRTDSVDASHQETKGRCPIDSGRILDVMRFRKHMQEITQEK